MEEVEEEEGELGESEGDEGGRLEKANWKRRWLEGGREGSSESEAAAAADNVIVRASVASSFFPWSADDNVAETDLVNVKLVGVECTTSRGG